MSDLLLAARRMRRQPGFAASVILTLALAIGASALSFSILDAVRFRALPLPNGDRLVMVAEVRLGSGEPLPDNPTCQTGCAVSYRTYKQVLAPHPFRSVSLVTAFASGGKALSAADDIRTVSGVVASPALFELLEVQPAIGRAFTPADNQLGAAPVALLGHGLWTSQFGQDPAILGTPVQLSDTRYTVVGIMPRGFDFESGAEFWLPEAPALDPSTRPSITNISVIAKLQPGASLEHFRAELSKLDLDAIPRAEGTSARRVVLMAVPLRARYVAATQGYDVLFLVIVGCVLVIACSNVTNMLLARALSDRRTLSIRRALGATGPQLARLIVVDHLLMVFAGAAVGLLLARWALPFVGAVDQLNAQRLTGMVYQLDFRVAAFSVFVAAIAAAAISLVPVALALRGDVHPVLREHGAGAGDGARAAYAQRAFVVAQLACAVGLVICGGSAVRRVMQLSNVRLGFDAAGVIQITPSLPHDWRVPEKYLPLGDRIVEELRIVPGAAGSTIRAFVPIGDATVIVPSGAAPLTPRLVPSAIAAVGPDYFETLQIPLIRGRTFDTNDRDRSLPVAIVNQWAAERWWPARDPVGESLRVTTPDGRSSAITIVGVAADNKAGQASLILAEDGPVLYRPYRQTPSPFASFFVRAAGSPDAVIAPARRRVARLVPNRPLSAQVISTVVAGQLGALRSTALQLTGVAAIGLFLAVVGVYGLLAYSVSRRTRELGIRRVLGATTGGVMTLVLGEALRLAGAGVVLGATGAWIAIRTIQPASSVASFDVGVYCAAAVVALTAAIVSALIPARRATAVSPQEALRG